MAVYIDFAKHVISTVMTLLFLPLSFIIPPTESYEAKRPDELNTGFTVLSDVHIEGNNFPTFENYANILKQVYNSKNNDTLVFLGDNTMNCQHIESIFFYGALKVSKPAENLIIAPGNHDYGNGTGAYCDWNLLLSDQGGPFHNRNDKTTASAGIIFEDKSKGCHAPVLFDADKKELVYTPIYYYIGHFSKYVERGAVRIATTKYTDNLQVCAFKNPDSKIVLVVYNTCDNLLPLIIRHNDVCTQLDIEPHSAITAIF